MNCDDAADCKEVSRDIVNLNRKGWIDAAESLCFKGIQAKFNQNEHLMETLLSTGEKNLVEASYDDVWGTRQHLGSKDCLNQTKWKSLGILGRILMKIRSERKRLQMDTSDISLNSEMSNATDTSTGHPNN